MASWWWPWKREEERLAITEEVIGRARQSAANDVASVRQQRRAFEEALKELMANAAERRENE